MLLALKLAKEVGLEDALDPMPAAAPPPPAPFRAPFPATLSELEPASSFSDSLPPVLTEATPPPPGEEVEATADIAVVTAAKGILFVFWWCLQHRKK